MPQNPRVTLAERKVDQARRETTIHHALRDRDKMLEKSKRDKKQKKKSVGELIALVNYCGVEAMALRPAWEYVPKSFNLDRQLTGLLNHMFVRYPVPSFLYAAFRKDVHTHKAHQSLYRHWFVTLAQGGSFPRQVKGFLTSKEAFVFLAAPSSNEIHENVWWARMKVAGLNDSTIDTLIERIFGNYFFDDPDGRLADVIRFYARYRQDMTTVTLGEITDFLAWKLRQEQAFSLKGRTITSVINLANEWHVLMQKAKLGQVVEWNGLALPDWEMETRDKIWTAVELRNNRELMNEGRKQKHCVYSYVHLCVSGKSAIFSLRSYRKMVKDCTLEGQVIWQNSDELNRITIEVNSHRAVVQVRGPLNRPPTDEEKTILRYWTGAKGLRMQT